jgi:hypothetical protein
MNSTPFSRPRLVCRIVRSSRALLERAGSRHLAGCAECQAFFRTSEQLELQLRRDAPVLRQTLPVPSSTLERDILRAVRESAAPAEPVRRGNLAWVGGAAATAAIAAFVWVQRPIAPQPSVAATPADAAAIVNAVQDLSARFTRNVIPSAGAMVANNPLQQELGSVYSDARSALDFLALNFLPSSNRMAVQSPPAGRI